VKDRLDLGISWVAYTNPGVSTIELFMSVIDAGLISQGVCHSQPYPP
jgi:hypothetical protein